MELMGAPADSFAAIPDEAETRRRLSELFNGIMRAAYDSQGAELSIDILASDQARAFIEAHAAVLDSSFARVEMSEAMRRRLHRSDFIFSGLKTFHEVNEVWHLIFDPDGVRRPFEQFLARARKVDGVYNRNYLRAEYNFIAASAEMAAKWERFAADGDRYNLQYRTQRDGRVRPEHAALDGVTLPPSDPFWEEFYPPNGWNCRCQVVQVRPEKYPATDRGEAVRRGNEALQRDTRGIFRFNPGVERSTVPAYNPYTIRRCRDCDIAKGKASLARRTPPDNQLCEACRFIRNMADGYSDIPVHNGKVRIHATHGSQEAQQNISIATYLAEKYGFEIDLLPNPDNEKSADSFNKTLGYTQEYKVNTIPTKGAVDNAIRKAAKQASHIVLKIDSAIDLSELTRGIKGRVSHSAIDEITIIHMGKDLTVTRTSILSKGFKIQQEDFK